MRPIVRISSILLTSCISTAALAETPYLVWCNGCSGSQISDAVLNSHASLGTTVYVGDPISGSYGAYMIYGDVDDSHKPPIHTRIVENSTGDANVLAGLHAWIEFYQFPPAGWNKQFAISYVGPDPTATGWTVASDGPARENFNDWLNTAGSGRKSLAQLWGTGMQALSALAKTDPTVLPSQAVTVTFGDNSTIIGVQDASCGCLKADPSTAKDAEGNHIPYVDTAGKLHNAGGNRHYNDDYQSTHDYESYVRQIAKFPIILQTPGGTQIGGGGSSGGSGGVTPVICTETDNDDNTKEITCFRG
jgi:hypothetical protein